MGLLELLRSVARKAGEPMGLDEGHPMWSADPNAPEAPDRDEREGGLFGLLEPRPRRRHGANGLDLGMASTLDAGGDGGDSGDSGGGSAACTDSSGGGGDTGS